MSIITNLNVNYLLFQIIMNFPFLKCPFHWEFQFTNIISFINLFSYSIILILLHLSRSLHCMLNITLIVLWNIICSHGGRPSITGIYYLSLGYLVFDNFSVIEVWAHPLSIMRHISYLKIGPYGCFSTKVVVCNVTVDAFGFSNRIQRYT